MAAIRGLISRLTRPDVRPVVLVVLVAALPRIGVLAYERGTILTQFVEKSDTFAQTFVSSGTFGFLPGVSSAYTQPLYAFFLSALYWPFGRSWEIVGIAQIGVAVVTALVVYEIGRRLRSRRVGVFAALVATLHPYLVWHDVHVNREILDGLLLAAVTLGCVVAFETGRLRTAAGVGLLCGIAVLGNSRLVLLPLVAGAVIAARLRPPRLALLAVAVVVGASAVAVAPWVVRNAASIGCATITTDARALWKANNLATYDVLAAGQWIDDVPELPGVPPWPEKAAEIERATGKHVPVDECAQMRFYRSKAVRFWWDHPGEKARLAAQATGMLWQPTLSVEADDPGRTGFANTLRKTAEPVFMGLLYALALVGAFLAPRRYVALAGGLLALNTAMAMLFAGTIRYRVPWDFLLAVLAAFAIDRLASWARAQRTARRAARTTST